MKTTIAKFKTPRKELCRDPSPGVLRDSMLEVFLRHTLHGHHVPVGQHHLGFTLSQLGLAKRGLCVRVHINSTKPRVEGLGLGPGVLMLRSSKGLYREQGSNNEAFWRFRD